MRAWPYVYTLRYDVLSPLNKPDTCKIEHFSFLRKRYWKKAPEQVCLRLLGVTFVFEGHGGKKCSCWRVGANLEFVIIACHRLKNIIDRELTESTR